MNHGTIPPSIDSVLPQVVGSQLYTTLHNGKQARVIQLNNAATTPPFQKTLEAVNSFLETYGALHRGAGPALVLLATR